MSGCRGAAVRAADAPAKIGQRANQEAELQELLRLQDARTPDQVKHVREDSHQTVERFLGGIGIKVENLSASARRFFDCIDSSVRHSVHEAKNTFDRTHLYQPSHNNLQTLKKLSNHNSPSYPSAHATYGAALGMVLAEMIPEKKGGALQARCGLRVQLRRFGRPLPERRLRGQRRRRGNCRIAPEQGGLSYRT